MPIKSHPTTSRTTVRLPLERKRDRQIDICRFGARKDRVTVIIEREVKHKESGHVLRREPLIEITPDGDVREFDAPRMRTRLAPPPRPEDGQRRSFGAARMNDRMLQLAAEAHRLVEQDNRRKQRPQRQRHRKPTRRPLQQALIGRALTDSKEPR